MDERIRGGAACSLALRAAYCMRVQYRSAVKERTTPPALRASVSVRVLPPLRSERLLDQVRERVRYLHFSIRTEQAYVHWVRAFVRFHDMRHPAEMGAAEVEAFLSWLAAERRVAVSTHRQVLSAIVFLYQKVFGFDLPWLAGIGRPQAPRRLPVVLSHGEVAAVLEAIESVEHRLFAELLYGTGMRLMEGLRLRVKDVEFERSAIVVREGKGRKDRVVMLPAALVPALQAQLRKARQLWQQDRADGIAGVQLPDALERKYPRAPFAWGWFWVFPQACGRSIRAAATPTAVAAMAAPSAATMRSTRASSARSSARSSLRASTSRRCRTRCAIRLRRTCCRPATTSAPSRSCSATPTSARR